MKSNIKLAISAAMVLGILVTSIPMLHADAVTAPAGQMNSGHSWRQTHPARAKDNDRIRHQRKLLKQDLKAGRITQDQYQAQMKDLNGIKQEERADAKANENGGHLTAGQQQAINSQLNESRKDINQDVKNDQVVK